MNDAIITGNERINIEPKDGKYSKNCFVNHASWEYEMISETEALLEPYREMLELYHSAYIELGRKIRQYSKTKVAQ